MATGKELRLPFLDWRLVELGLNLPLEKMFDGGLTKSIIRSVMKNRISDQVRLAQKRSIQAPQGLWLRSKPMKTYVYDLISSTKFRNRGIYNHKEYTRKFDEFCKGRMPNSFFVWQMSNSELWFETFIEN